MEEIKKDVKEKCENVLRGFSEEINKIRAGRPTPALVEDIRVEAYGTKTPIKQIASISIQGPRDIMIEPWDKSIIKEIEKAVSNSELKASVSVLGGGVQLTLPKLSEERRNELVRILHDKKEDARIAIRNIREDAWRETQERERKKEISEDDKFRLKDALQEVVDDYNKKIDESADKKEKELKTV